MQKANITYDLQGNQIINNRFLLDRRRLLGQGVSGQVYILTDIQQQKQYAVKIIQLIQYCEKEEDSWLQVRGKYVCELIDSFIGVTEMYFIMQYANQGSLETFMKQRKDHKSIRYQEIQRICYLIAQGYLTIHKAKIIHRDLKPSNIVLHNGIPKICDFGVSKKIQNCDNIILSNFGTPQYTPPEALQSGIYITNYKSDIFSLGLIFYFCFYLDTPKCPKLQKDLVIFYNQLQNNGPRSEIEFKSLKLLDVKNVDHQMQDLICSMLEFDFKKRIGIKEVLNHPAFQLLRNLPVLFEISDKLKNDFLNYKNNLRNQMIVLQNQSKLEVEYSKRIVHLSIKRYFIQALSSNELCLNMIVEEDTLLFSQPIILFLVCNLHLSTLVYLDSVIDAESSSIPSSMKHIPQALENFKSSPSGQEIKSLIQCLLLQSVDIYTLLIETLNNVAQVTEYKCYSSSMIRSDLKDNLNIPEKADKYNKLLQEVILETFEDYKFAINSDMEENQKQYFRIFSFFKRSEFMNEQFYNFDFANLYQDSPPPIQLNVDFFLQQFK